VTAYVGAVAGNSGSMAYDGGMAAISVTNMSPTLDVTAHRNDEQRRRYDDDIHGCVASNVWRRVNISGDNGAYGGGMLAYVSYQRMAA